VSWELASYLIVGIVVFVGFAWYERSRPPAQVVALVAALAALAVAGRVAFAAFPNLKPTTDIIVFAGYALGGAPGFAVGALTALVSNFWFGQGPWTPWQMAAWGLCGVLGALLALGTRNAGRFTLAAICGFAGIFFGALLNCYLMATDGGDLSLRHFLAYEAQGIAFEAAHVGGNVVLALVAGPAMVRMLTRFRERFEWQRRSAPAAAPPGGQLRGALRSGGIAALILLALLVVTAPAARAASSVERGADWLESQQRLSGGFAASAEREAGAEITAWAMIGLAAANRNPLDVVKNGRTPVDFLRNHLDEVKDAGDLARTILALEATGVDPRSFGGSNLVDQLLAKRGDNGSYQGWPGTSAYAVLALRAAGANSEASPTVAWLRKVQGKEGGWGNLPEDQSTAEITGAVLQVLTPGSNASDRALAYLRKQKRENGGFAPGNNLAANAQSTAWTSEGLLAAGKDPSSFGPGKSSYAYIRDLQTDHGYFLKAAGDETTPVWVTANALVPLAGQHLPVPAPPRAPKPKPKPLTSTNPSHDSGGVTPSLDVPQSSAGPASKALEEALEGGAGARPPGHSAPSGQSGSGALPDLPSTGGRVPEGDAGTALPSTSASEASGEQAAETSENDTSSTAGAIILGLLAGCLLFGAGLAGRRGWMRWRYGL
jgi:Prenyltransferase and squalene oxidase repeat